MTKAGKLLRNVSYLKEHFWVSKSGIIFWKKCRIKAKEGTRLRKHKSKSGYYSVFFNRTHLRYHRLVFVLWHGRVPNQIDHINRIKTDNRICNLRSVSQSENMHNARKHKDNTSGVKGLFAITGRKYWQVTVQLRKKKYSKCFKQKADARKYLKNLRKKLYEKHGYLK